MGSVQCLERVKWNGRSGYGLFWNGRSVVYWFVWRGRNECGMCLERVCRLFGVGVVCLESAAPS